MNSLKKLIFFFTILSIAGNVLHAQCNASNSPIFQLTTIQATLATNGVCGVQINIVNANTSPPGGPVSYSIIAPGQGTLQPPVLAIVAGTWTVTVKDNGNFCITTQTVQVTVLPAPSISIAANTTLFCSGKTITLTTSGAANYTWNTQVTTPSISIALITTAGYSLVGMGSNGCANIASTLIMVKPLPSITLTASQNSVCANETIQLIALGATTYSWSTSQTGADVSVSPSITSTYTVNGTDSSGCEAHSQISVSVSLCTDIRELNTENYRGISEKFKIFPKPANDFIELKIIDIMLSNGTKTISIYNSFGQKIKEEINTNDDLLKINITELEPGIYYLQLKNNTTTIQPKCFVISH